MTCRKCVQESSDQHPCWSESVIVVSSAKSVKPLGAAPPRVSAFPPPAALSLTPVGWPEVLITTTKPPSPPSVLLKHRVTPVRVQRWWSCESRAPLSQVNRGTRRSAG